MDKSQPRVSLIKLLEVVFRIYREWEDENDKRIVRRASQIALETGRNLLTKKEAAALRRVVNGSESWTGIEEAEHIVYRLPDAPATSFKETAVAELNERLDERPIELRLWNFVVFQMIKPRWTGDIPGEEFDDDAIEPLIRIYCVTLVSEYVPCDEKDGALTNMDELRARPDVHAADEVRTQIARLDKADLGDMAFVEMKKQFAEIVPRIENMLGLSDSEAVHSWEPTPNSREHLAIIALYEQKAFDYNSRITIKRIAEKAADSSRDNFTEVMASLKSHGITDSKTGRSGGCWLTEIGRNQAERLA